MKRLYILNILGLLLIVSSFYIKHKDLLDLFHNEVRGFPTTDWVVWDYNNCTAEDVLPPVKESPYTKYYYVEKGDKLIKLNFNNIIVCNQLRQVFFSKKPTDVVAYHLLTPNNETKKLFVFLSPAPMFLFQNSAFIWSFSFWLYPILMLMVGILTMLIYPFLRRAESSFNFLFVSGILLFLLFALQEIRLIVFQNDYELKMVTFSEFLYFTVIFILILLDVIFFLSFIIVSTKKNLILSVLIALLTTLFIFLSPYNYFYLVFIERILFLIWAWQSLLFLIKHKYHKAFIIFPILAIIIFLLFFGDLNTNDRFISLFFISLFYPLFANIPTLFKYGKVYLVLSRSIALFIGVFLVGLLYLTIEQAFGFFGETSKFKGLIEIFIIMIIAFVGYYLYNKYGNAINKVIKVGELHIYKDILEWSENLLHYTDIKTLLNDFEKLLKEKAKISNVIIISKRIDKLNPTEKQMLKEMGENTWWTSTRLGNVEFSEPLLQWINQNQIELLFIVRINPERILIVGLGEKESGVYNFSDIDILGTIIRRIALSLRVLYLMEREKLLEKQKIEAELSALRSQINPHFLFNTLNAISSLIHEDPDLAEEAIEELATLFRFTLQHSKQQFIPLQSEIKMIKSYLRIEQIRFGERLKVEFNVAPGTIRYLVPGLVIQTVIENAFKHGVAKITKNAVVKINIYEKDDFIFVEIEDNGPGIDTSKVYSSTGLNNLITRMTTIFNRSDLIYFINTGNGTKVIIKFPKLEP